MQIGLLLNRIQKKVIFNLHKLVASGFIIDR